MNSVLRHIGDLVSGALAFGLTLIAASSCLDGRQGPDSFDKSHGFCFVIGAGEGTPAGCHEDSGGDLVFESSQDTVRFHGVVSDEGLMNRSSTKAISDLSLNMFDSSRLYEETSEYMSLGVFGASAVHGSSFTGLDLCDDCYFTKSANSYYFYGPELNTRLSLQFDVKFWAYYPKFRSGDGGLYDGTGFENGKPYVDFHNCSDANADVGSEFDLLYGSSSVIYGSALGAVPMSLNHALAAFAVGISDGNGCDFGEITKVRIRNVYNRGRFYLDGSWSSRTIDPDIIISSYDNIDVDVASGDSGSDLLSDDDGFCAFMIPQTCPSGAVLEIDFNDGYSIRTMSASMEGLTFVAGHVYKLLINPDFDSSGYVHLQHETNTIYVPWTGGSYGYDTEDMDDLAVWCTCGNNCSFFASVQSNTGIVFSELNADDGGYYDYLYHDGDGECDWFRENGDTDCSRLQMVVAPNFSSSQLEAVIRIECAESEGGHKSYELLVVQDGNPNAGSYYLYAKDVVIPFVASNSGRLTFSAVLEDFIETNIVLDNGGVDYFSEGGLPYSLSKNVVFLFHRNYDLDGWFDYYESDEYCICDFVSIYYNRNYSLVDVWIPYTVSIGSMSSSAYIILKAGNYSSFSLSLSPSSLELIYGGGIDSGYKQLKSYFNYRISGDNSSYSILLDSYGSSSSGSPTLIISDPSIAYRYYGRYIRAKDVGETEAVVRFMDFEARASVRVVPPSLSVSPDVQTFTSSGGTSSRFTVSSNTRWRMTQKPDWVTSLSGIALNSSYTGNRTSTMTYNVSENTGGPREGYFVFETQSGYGTPQQTVRMTVRQQGAGGVSLEGWGDGGIGSIVW